MDDSWQILSDELLSDSDIRPDIRGILLGFFHDMDPGKVWERVLGTKLKAHGSVCKKDDRQPSLSGATCQECELAGQWVGKLPGLGSWELVKLGRQVGERFRDVLVDSSTLADACTECFSVVNHS